ncbi:MAG: ATP-binding protein [Deltaproteobacteria bacterium]|jgi:Mg-chelatase subunit ChlI|nr:ATP-binding protein [Deltaproteobacteria bacterium]
MPDFPFSAVVGQHTMQTALLAAAVDPGLGGVLIRGQKGTAKSTVVRALVSVLPPILAVADCPYHCPPDNPALMHDGCRQRLQDEQKLVSEEQPTPFVDLPLSATEDRLIGTLHLGKTLQTGERHFEAGLFAAANRGILYVDEVNLLPDHLVDLLLDVASSGINRVEREGLRFSHPAQFLLIGSMNPEEGELRPQFLDRFGLCVSVTGLSDHALRREIITRRLAYEQDPEAFCRTYAAMEGLLRQQVRQAQARLPEIILEPEALNRAVALSSAGKTQGHRAELAIVRTARALAALCERNTISLADIDEAARYALPHRLGDALGATPEDMLERLPRLLETANGDEPVPAEEDLLPVDSLMENMDFPGSAAAGSMLFTYLKKKLMTDISVQTKRSS